MTKDIVMNTGTRGGMILLMQQEMLDILFRCKWMVLLVVIVVVADFWYGKGESRKRYERALEDNDTAHQLEYRWRTSRAIRRTCNKFIDYMLWLCVAVILGMAFLDPLGVDFIYAVVGAMSLAMYCELKSLLGHFFFLRGMTVKERTVKGFFRSVLVSYLKHKSPDIGEAVEDGFKDNDK